jgi:hypothetical protein
MSKKEHLLKFIEDKELTFTFTGSDLNGECVELVGYADYLDYKDQELLDDLEELKLSFEATKEIERVFRYAKTHKYGKIYKR